MTSSRVSLFSPGTTIRGASPAALGMTGNDWSRKSNEGGFTPIHYGAGTAVSMLNSTQGSNFGGNPFKNPEGRAMRRMISIENEAGRGSQNYVPSPGTNLLQSRTNLRKEEFGSITPNTSAKKDLVLPEIGGGPFTLPSLQSSTNSKFNAGITSVTPKMQINPTGGAGFNSNNTPSYIPSAFKSTIPSDSNNGNN